MLEIDEEISKRMDVISERMDFIGARIDIVNKRLRKLEQAVKPGRIVCDNTEVLKHE